MIATWKTGDISDPSMDIEVIPGGIDPPPSWDEYLDHQGSKWRPFLLAIRKAVLEPGSRLRRTTGAQRSNYGYFECRGESGGDEDVVLNVAFTWRAWGDLMQSIEDKREGYMRYYG